MPNSSRRAWLWLPLLLAACGANPSVGAGPGMMMSGSGGHVGAGAGGSAGAAGNRAGESGANSGGGSTGSGGESSPSNGQDARGNATEDASSDDVEPPAADAGSTSDVALPPAGAFRHPGVLVNQAELDFVRAKVAAGLQPWKAAFDAARTRGALDHKAAPLANVICGSYSMPNIGCAEELNDAIAAWSDALVWAVGGEEAYAKKAIEIMNAWAAVLKTHSDSNAPLQAGWAASLWPRAAEIIRHGYGGWAKPDVDAFAKLLRDVYLPLIIKGGGGTNGNWDLTMIDASMNIAVFLDDRATFDRTLTMWRKRVPAYLYLAEDGPRPVQPPGSSKDIVAYWQGQSTFVDGLSQETCRDLLHTQLGMSSAINAAETAYQQGVDLYGEQSRRLRAGLEFHADYLLGKPAPAWLCGGKLNLRLLPMWEIAFNHYKNRLGLALPLTEQLLVKVRTTTSGVYKQMAFETLTHAETAWAGLK
jgi:hypothetical protein